MNQHRVAFGIFFCCIFYFVCIDAWAAVGRFSEEHQSRKVESVKREVRGQPYLQNFGNAMLANVKVYNIFWSTSVPYQATLDYFVSSITQSPYLDWVSEYNTGAISIGEGSWLGSTNLGSTDQSVSQNQITLKLVELIDSAIVPIPDENTLFVFYFDQQTTITAQSGDVSCTANSFCGFHTVFNYKGSVYPYAVIADCAAGCGPSELDSITVTVSHEILESVTDTIPGQGWYDPISGEEVCDICSFYEAFTNPADQRTWYVNPGWSNSAGGCIVQRNGTTLTAPNTSSAATRSASSFFMSLLQVDED